MKGFARKALKYTGYTLFFVVALVFFFYLTLPMDTVQDYLVRKASDEYNADLEITELSTWRLTGFHAEGVTITPRPTAEDLQEMRLAREAHAAWKAKQAEKKEEAKAKKEAKKEEDGTKPPDPKDVAAKIKAGKRASRAGKKEKAEKPPPIPRGPSPLFIENLRAKVSPFALMSGDIDGYLEATMLNGELTGEVKQAKGELALNAQWENLDLAQLDVLESFLPLPLVGGLNGDIELATPIEKDKLKLSEAEGAISLRIQSAAIGPGKIESAKLGAFPYFEVPETRIQDLSGQLVFGNKKAVFENFEFSGKDLEGEITGYIKLNDKFERWAPRAHLRFKFSDTFMAAHKAVKTAMTSIPYLKRGQREGYTGFSVSGTMKKMRWQPRKDSPHKRKARSAKRPEKEGAKTGRGLDRTGKGKSKAATTSKTRDRKSLRDLKRGRDKGTTRPKLGKSTTKLPPIAKRGTDPSSATEEEEEDEEEEEEEEDEEEETEEEDGEETKGEETKGEGKGDGGEGGEDSEEGKGEESEGAESE